jgi:HK97 family phage prohead protease
VAGGGDVHLLVHHDFDRPLASRAAGSLEIRDGDDALTFEATIAPEMRGVGYVTDFLSAHSAGLVGGISPGFMVRDGGDMVKRDSEGLLRVVRSAQLVEISAVTKPAYPQAQIEARRWDTDQDRDARRQLGPWLVPHRWRL